MRPSMQNKGPALRELAEQYFLYEPVGRHHSLAVLYDKDDTERKTPKVLLTPSAARYYVEQGIIGKQTKEEWEKHFNMEKETDKDEGAGEKAAAEISDNSKPEAGDTVMLDKSADAPAAAERHRPRR